MASEYKKKKTIINLISLEGKQSDWKDATESRVENGIFWCLV